MFSVAQQKKQEEKNLQKVRDLLRLPANKKCFDCPTKSPFFVNVSVQTFVCSRCSGLVREVGHRVKSISASKFSGAEVVALQQGGNQVARAIWLSNYGKDNIEPETDAEVREFIRQKYYEQKWLDQERLTTHSNAVREMIKAMFTEEGIRRPGAKTPPLPGQDHAPTAPVKRHQQRPASLQLTSSSWKPANGSGNNSSGIPSPSLIDGVYAPPPLSAREIRSTGVAPISPVIASVPVTPSSRIAQDPAPTTPTGGIVAPQPLPASPSPVRAPATPTTAISNTITTPTSSIFSELAGLDTSSKPSRRATYTGGILTPATPGAASPTRSTPFSSIIGGGFSSSSESLFKSPQTSQPHHASTSPLSPSYQSQPSLSSPPPPPPENDPYAALRGLNGLSIKESQPQQPQPQQPHIPSGGAHERQDSEDTAWTEFSTSTTAIDDFGDFSSSEPLDAVTTTAIPKSVAAPTPPSNANVNLFGDLDPLAQFKRSSR